MNRLPTAAALRTTPTQCESQACDLHHEEDYTPNFSTVRLWVSRCGIMDGEPFPNTVYVEVLDYIGKGRPDWYELGHYDGDNLPESLPNLSADDLHHAPKES